MADGIRSKTNPKSGADSTALDAEQCSNAARVRQQSGAAYANAKQIQATSAISSYQQQHLVLSSHRFPLYFEIIAFGVLNNPRES